MFTSMFTSFILLVLVFRARADSPGQDSSLVAKVNEVIQNVDHYLEDHKQEDLDLPNIGLLPLDPLKLRNGKFGKFSTLEVLDVPFVNQTQMDDGSTVYDFRVTLGLKEFRFRYDFEMNAVVFQRKGSFNLAAQENSVEVSGRAVVSKDKSCDATLTSVKVLQYGDFKITLQPNDIPQATQLSEQLMNMVTPLVVPVTNKVLELAALAPYVAKPFAQLTCKAISL